MASSPITTFALNCFIRTNSVGFFLLKLSFFRGKYNEEAIEKGFKTSDKTKRATTCFPCLFAAVLVLAICIVCVMFPPPLAPDNRLETIHFQQASNFVGTQPSPSFNSKSHNSIQYILNIFSQQTAFYMQYLPHLESIDTKLKNELKNVLTKFWLKMCELSQTFKTHLLMYLVIWVIVVSSKKKGEF